MCTTPAISRRPKKGSAAATLRKSPQKPEVAAIAGNFASIMRLTTLTSLGKTGSIAIGRRRTTPSAGSLRPQNVVQTKMTIGTCFFSTVKGSWIRLGHGPKAKHLKAVATTE
jgi:hypothetical protein